MEAMTEVKKRRTTMYVLRVRQPSGEWIFDMGTPMPKREAEYQQKRLRILLGVTSQLWTENEAATVVAELQ